MHLYLALFWLILGIVGQVYWDILEPHMLIPVHRTVFGFIFFVIISYNLVRWRVGRLAQQTQDDTTEMPPRPRVIHREYNPDLDFSKPDPDEKKPPTV